MIDSNQRILVFRSQDLSTPQRQAVEILLGRTLTDDEAIYIQIAKHEIAKSAPSAEDRNRILDAMQARAEVLAQRVANVPQAEVDAVLAEALEAARRSRPLMALSDITE